MVELRPAGWTPTAASSWRARPEEVLLPPILETLHALDGERVTAEHMSVALTAGRLVYEDGAVQTFEPDGKTVYVVAGRTSDGEWHLNREGHFCSHWPPAGPTSYDLHWIVEKHEILGLRFTGHGGGPEFVGRYE